MCSCCLSCNEFYKLTLQNPKLYQTLKFMRCAGKSFLYKTLGCSNSKFLRIKKQVGHDGGKTIEWKAWRRIKAVGSTVGSTIGPFSRNAYLPLKNRTIMPELSVIRGQQWLGVCAQSAVCTSALCVWGNLHDKLTLGVHRVSANHLRVHSVKSARAINWLVLNACKVFANRHSNLQKHRTKKAYVWRSMQTVHFVGGFWAQTSKMPHRAPATQNVPAAPSAVGGLRTIFCLSTFCFSKKMRLLPGRRGPNKATKTSSHEACLAL